VAASAAPAKANGPSTSKGAPSSTANPRATARPVAGIFFPQRPLLKLGVHGYSAAILHKIVGVAGEVKAHKAAAKVLQLSGKLPISSRHVNRLTEEIGKEMEQQRDRRTEDYVHHRREEPAVTAPEVVAIGLDGGRVMTRAPGQGVGVHEQQWKEDKVACLLALKGQTFAEDPHPEPPKCFVDAPEVDKLVRALQAHHGPRQENELPQLADLSLGRQGVPDDPRAETAKSDTATSKAQARRQRLWPPRRAKEPRTCVATMADCGEFGKMVAAEAYRRNFQQAKRGALLGDGSAWIWNLHTKWFTWLTPVADFVHPLTYLYVTATVLAANVRERWQWYVQWMTWCWQGRVQEVIEDLQTRLSQREPYAGAGRAPPTDAREVLRRTLTYLRHNEPRMRYAEYRQQGLPVTSSLVESLIKEVNYRVKGTEKFWDRPEGAEAILQVRAAVLSDDDRLARHIENRPGSALRRHTPRKLAKVG
jgi:hypothetical protein